MKKGNDSHIVIFLQIFTILLLLALSSGASGCGKKGNNSLEAWQEKIENSTGNDSVESVTLRACSEGMRQKVAECEGYEGWMVDNIISILDFKTKERYEVKDLRMGGCPGLRDKDDPRPFTADSKFYDAMSERKSTSFQILCQIACYSWPCEKNETENEPVVKTNYPSEGMWDGKFQWYSPEECYADAEAQGYGSGYLSGSYEQTRQGPKLSNFRLTNSMPYTNPNNGNPLVEGQKYEWDGFVGSTKYHFEGTLQGTEFSGIITLYERCASASSSNNIQQARFSMKIVSY